MSKQGLGVEKGIAKRRQMQTKKKRGRERELEWGVPSVAQQKRI